MREVSAHADTIEFHTIHVDVSGIDISVQNPSNTTKVNLSFNNAVVSGNTLTTAGAIESAIFDSLKNYRNKKKLIFVCVLWVKKAVDLNFGNPFLYNNQL